VSTPADDDRLDAYLAALLDDDPVELYEQAPCAYLSLVPDGTIVKVNRTFLAWTGYSRGVVGSRFQELLPAGGRIFHETQVVPLLRLQGAVREIAADVICADGSRLPVLLNAATSFDADGAPRMFRVVLLDATERRSYERELVAARQRAEASEQQARALAQTLQASLLPPELLVIPGLDVAGAYRPAGDGSEVGGDFYDVFETGRGSWGIVLGDVSGKGAAAAAVTALARYTVRAEAVRSSSPSAVLRALNEAILRFHVDRFCTALLLEVEGAADGFRITLASGGHHLPIRRRHGQVGRVGVEGTFLGMLEEVQLTDAHVALDPGDVLVLYTDGVSEARSGGRFFDDEGVQDLVRGAGDLDARGLAELILTTAVDFQGGVTRDDIAVVVVRRG
jgi:sigma-B regulation protein RsbU (phosphoserine phosphatase)